LTSSWFCGYVSTANLRIFTNPFDEQQSANDQLLLQGHQLVVFYWKSSDHFVYRQTVFV